MSTIKLNENEFNKLVEKKINAILQENKNLQENKKGKSSIQLTENELCDFISECVEKSLIEEGWLGDKWNQVKAATTTALGNNDATLKGRINNARNGWQAQGDLNYYNGLISQLSQLVDSRKINPNMTIAQFIGGSYNKGRYGTLTGIADNRASKIKQLGGKAYR